MFPSLIKRILFLGMISLWRHRLRSALTVLGIVFGVCSVIAMLAIGEGASSEAQEQIRRLGSQNIIINSIQPPKSDSATGQETSRMSEYGLTYKDAARISSTIPTVDVIVPSRSIRADLYFRTKHLEADAVGTIPWYPKISNKQVARGRFINEEEMADQKNVCVLSAEVARRLFTIEDPIGEIINIRSDYYKVIGIMEEAKTAAKDGAQGSGTLQIFIPITAAKSRFGEIIMSRSTGSFNVEKIELHQIIVKVKELSQVIGTSEVIKALLEQFHKKLDYEVVVPLQLLENAEKTKRLFNIVLGSIAAISLLVGGIGIMNIMLASVTERTREIGIRRALGAKRRDIIIQFLTETVLLSTTGGVIGLGLGVLIPFLITHFTDMMTIVKLWSLIVALGISVCIGIVFGIYPAYRAAMMNPIDALRHE